MITRKRSGFALLFLALLVALSACAGGITTRRTHIGNKGQIVVKIGAIEEPRNTSVELDEDWSWDTVDIEVQLEVEVGSCRATLTDDDGETLTLEASAGSPASGRALFKTDGFGEIDLQVAGPGTQGVEVTIDYTRP